jgi:hypothetical protein
MRTALPAIVAACLTWSLPAAAQEAEAGPVPVSELVQATVVSSDGEQVGIVDRIVQSVDDDSLHVVVSYGGIAGFARAQVRLPIEDVEVADGALRARQSLDEVRALPQWRSDNPGFRGFFGAVPIARTGAAGD